MITCFLNIFVLIPGLLLKNRFKLFTFLFILSILLLNIGSALIEYYIHQHFQLKPGRYSYFANDNRFILGLSTDIVLYALCVIGTCSIPLFRHWFNYNKRSQELEKTNLQTELKRLKNQINPVFLFNVLEKAKDYAFNSPEKSSSILMLISKILRYQLYDCTRSKVNLISELTVLDNFLKLRKLCYTNFAFSITTSGTVNRVQIPPLLFIPFVEYAERYLPKNEEAYIHIITVLKDQKLDFSCICSISESVIEENADDLEKSISNIKRRLELLYHEKHRLTITENKDHYRVQLQLTI